MFKNKLGIGKFWKYLVTNRIKPYKYERNIKNFILFRNSHRTQNETINTYVKNWGFTYSVLLRNKWYNKIYAGNFPKVPVLLDNINISTEDFYRNIYGRNCENVIGYVPIPVGIVGPININNRLVHVPIATTEGVLVASLNRGSKILHASFYY